MSVRKRWAEKRRRDEEDSYNKKRLKAEQKALRTPNSYYDEEKELYVVCGYGQEYHYETYATMQDALKRISELNMMEAAGMDITEPKHFDDDLFNV